MSSQYIVVVEPATRELPDDLGEGPPRSLDAIIGRFAHGAARVHILDTERASLQARVTQLESKTGEWWRDYRDLASVTRPLL